VKPLTKHSVIQSYSRRPFSDHVNSSFTPNYNIQLKLPTCFKNSTYFSTGIFVSFLGCFNKELVRTASCFIHAGMQTTELPAGSSDYLSAQNARGKYCVLIVNEFDWKITNKEISLFSSYPRSQTKKCFLMNFVTFMNDITNYHNSFFISFHINFHVIRFFDKPQERCHEQR
jgi:hypothetical protein